MVWQRGTRWGVDVGTVRVGLAQADADGILPTPYKTVKRDAKTDSDIRYLAKLAAQEQVLLIYVGLPQTLSGGESASTRMATEYAGKLQSALRTADSAAQVRLVDERLSSVSAHRSLREAGVSGREQRKVVDQVAAAGILEQAIASEKRAGKPAGDAAMGAE